MFDRRFFRHAIPLIAGALVHLTLVFPVHALSMKECSVKFKAAQDAGEATGVSWSEFRKSQCARPVDPGAAANSAASGTTGAKPEPAQDKPKKMAKATGTPSKATSDQTTFPSSVATRFAAEKPAKARMHTCLEEYHANRKAGTLGDMRWIEKGGGYYKLCNARLKGDG